MVSLPLSPTASLTGQRHELEFFRACSSQNGPQEGHRKQIYGSQRGGGGKSSRNLGLKHTHYYT